MRRLIIGCSSVLCSFLLVAGCSSTRSPRVQPDGASAGVIMAVPNVHADDTSGSDAPAPDSFDGPHFLVQGLVLEIDPGKPSAGLQRAVEHRRLVSAAQLRRFCRAESARVVARPVALIRTQGASGQAAWVVTRDSWVGSFRVRYQLEPTGKDAGHVQGSMAIDSSLTNPMGFKVGAVQCEIPVDRHGSRYLPLRYATQSKTCQPGRQAYLLVRCEPFDPSRPLSLP